MSDSDQQKRVADGEAATGLPEQGRVIFENIRKFVVYLLSGNVGEILTVGVAATAGTVLPLLPLQILYINILNSEADRAAKRRHHGTKRSQFTLTRG